jgi:hypothetical protein
LGQKFAGFTSSAFIELSPGGTLAESIKDMPAKNIIVIRREQLPE